MDGDLLQAYSNTGVVHVIAISGLHLALIHGILLWMMTPLFRGGKWSGMGAMVVLPCLWIYAFFTGASASVIRSAAMFTGIGMARAMDKRQFLLNGLASSALVLMAFRPDWISDIGCQLSYAALLSIAIFQPAIRDLMKVTNPLGVMVRDMVSVTLAAQVLTAPLVAWHFHRLPLLFLFSNIPVVPLSSLILLICLLICAFSGLSQIASPLGKLASLLIELMNGHVKAMDAVPYSSLTDLRLTTSQVICIYAMIVLAWWGRIEKRRIGWLLAGACMLTCQIIGLFNDHKHELQQDIVVFNVRKQSLYAIVDGRNMLVLAGDQERADTLTRDKCIRQAVDHFQTRSPTMLRLSPGKSCHWTAGNARWEVTCGSGWTRITKGRDVFSVLVRSGSWGPEVRDRQPESVVVADASCPLWKIQQWKSTPDGVPSRFHSVPEQGAFISAMDKSRRPSH
jgi:competence protein ComEC